MNYRSAVKILCSGTVALCEEGRHLRGEESGDKIQIRGMYDPFQEADYLTGRIRELHVGASIREMAIFTVCRTSQKFLNMCLKKRGIPFEVSLKRL